MNDNNFEFSLDDRPKEKRFSLSMGLFLLGSIMIIIPLINVIVNFSLGALVTLLLVGILGGFLIYFAIGNYFQKQIMRVNEKGIFVSDNFFRNQDMSWEIVSTIGQSPYKVNQGQKTLALFFNDGSNPYVLSAQDNNKFDEMVEKITFFYEKHQKQDMINSTDLQKHITDDKLQVSDIPLDTMVMSAPTFYVFTVKVGVQEVIKTMFNMQELIGEAKNILLFDYANQPAILGDNSISNITISKLPYLVGNWALILPLDVLPHLEKSSAWSLCKGIQHLDDPLNALITVIRFMREKEQE